LSGSIGIGRLTKGRPTWSAAGAVRGRRLGRVGAPRGAAGEMAVQRVGGDGVEIHGESSGCATFAGGGVAVAGGRRRACGGVAGGVCGGGGGGGRGRSRPARPPPRPPP